jgi:hypothetical protein
VKVARSHFLTISNGGSATERPRPQIGENKPDDGDEKPREAHAAPSRRERVEPAASPVDPTRPPCGAKVGACTRCDKSPEGSEPLDSFSRLARTAAATLKLSSARQNSALVSGVGSRMKVASDSAARRSASRNTVSEGLAPFHMGADCKAPSTICQVSSHIC